MAEKQEVQKYIKGIVDRLNDVHAVVLNNCSESVLFLISDLKTGWKLKMAVDGSVESCVETTDESSAGVMEMDSDTFVGVYSEKLDVIGAYDSGKVKIRGELGALVKLMPHTII